MTKIKKREFRAIINNDKRFNEYLFCESPAHAVQLIATRLKNAANRTNYGGHVGVKIYDCADKFDFENPTMERVVKCLPNTPSCNSRKGHTWQDYARQDQDITATTAICYKCGLEWFVIQTDLGQDIWYNNISSDIEKLSAPEGYLTSRRNKTVNNMLVGTLV